MLRVTMYDAVDQSQQNKHQTLETLMSLPDFNKHELIPAIAQCHETGTVLMMAWMNKESWEETLKTERACYFSRSRQKLWRKGEESGNVQEVHGIYYDCDADALLFSADFRGEERMAQLLTQVAGRAGRAELVGSVMLQTHYPDHPALLAMLTTSYGEQARAMLKRRQESGMPPAGQLVLLRTDCPNAEYGEQFLRTLRERCTPQLPSGARLIGPLPSPMQRRAGKYRCQLLLSAPDRRSAQAAAGLLVANAETMSTKQGLNWTIDIDPQDVF